MSDIALTLVSNLETGPRFDFSQVDGDLALDDGLTTPVIVSLFSDRLAADDDAIPDGSSDKRGWWGDLALDGETTGDEDLLGSRLWLLERAKASAQNRTLAEKYVAEGLSWLKSDAVVGGVKATATLDAASGRLNLAVSVLKSSGGSSAASEYNTIWAGTL